MRLFLLVSWCVLSGCSSDVSLSGDQIALWCVTPAIADLKDCLLVCDFAVDDFPVDDFAADLLRQLWSHAKPS